MPSTESVDIVLPSTSRERRRTYYCEDNVPSLRCDDLARAGAIRKIGPLELPGLSDRDIVDTGIALEQSHSRDLDREARQAVFHGAINPLGPSLLLLEELPPMTQAEASAIIRDLREARAAIEASAMGASRVLAGLRPMRAPAPDYVTCEPRNLTHRIKFRVLKGSRLAFSCSPGASAGSHRLSVFLHDRP
jgi:hypothetical protein